MSPPLLGVKDSWPLSRTEFGEPLGLVGLTIILMLKVIEHLAYHVHYIYSFSQLYKVATMISIYRCVNGG